MHSFVRTALVTSAAFIAVPALAAGLPADDQQISAAGTGATAPEQEILVTARRRQETSQEVPLAISVVGGDHIDNTGSFNVGRLTQLTPSVTFYSSNPRNSAANIRGLGAPFGLTNDGIEQGVGIYVDDVYYSRAASSTFDFLDVAQIEVLRGPQGTLYGKNTTAGAINIATRQPTFDFEGRAEVTVGNLGFKQAKAAVSGPLSDRLAARIALSSTSRRGTIFNVTSGNWINEQDNLGLRAQLLLRATDTLDITLAGDYSAQNPECCGTVYVRTGSTQRPLARQYAALAAAQNFTVVSTNAFDRLTDIDANLNAGNKIGGASLRIKWDLGAGEFTSVTAWRFWDWKPENDRDFTGLPIVTKSQNPSQQNQYTQEFRYSQSGDQLDFVLGAFAYHQRIDTQGTEQHGPASSRWNINPTNALAGDPAVLNGLTALNTQYLINTSAALFGQASWKVTDALSIQPGVRLNYDKKKGFYDRKVFDGLGNPVLLGQSGAVKAAQLAIFAPQSYAPEGSDWNFSYDLTLSYELAADVLAYATYAKTFKSFGINQNGVPNDTTGVPALAAQTILPESLNHYEAGIKAQFWNRKATFNLSIFRTDITDYQAQVTNGSLGLVRGYLANAQQVRSQGIEVDFSLRPSDRFNVYVNGAYNDAKYRKFVDAPCPPELSGGGSGAVIGAPGVPGTNSPANCDISGQRLPGVSEWTFSYGAEYNVPAKFLGQDGQVYLGFDGNYRSSFSSNPSPSAYTWVDGYSLNNFRLGFRTDAGFDIFGWVRNAFDVQFFEALNVPGGNTGLITGQPGDPRTFGATIKATF
ncbi:TonB-dependent receptor [Novosphingobium sp.]|uniref:TonB-dependent receptor n=1 Tax=Novosphingobium sp. TaxID=1874826 RepID=UPI0027337DA3|nr:TonB-dependent receptor [Novosphingobium sp.]MDP3908009.1 TonB-dependent receptor [Novosphingobium sp.]